MVDILKIETERLILRPYTPEDWEAVHEYGADPDFSKYEMWGPNSVEDTKKFIADMMVEAATEPRYRFGFAVHLKSEDRLIGGCGIRRDSQQSSMANLGWSIHPNYQGQGFATEPSPGKHLIAIATSSYPIQNHKRCQAPHK